MDRSQDKIVYMHILDRPRRSNIYLEEIFFREIIFLDGYFIASIGEAVRKRSSGEPQSFREPSVESCRSIALHMPADP